MKNVDVREKAKEKGVNLWQIAERMGIHDTALSKRLRHEFTEAEKERTMQIISEIAAEEAKENENENDRKQL